MGTLSNPYHDAKASFTYALVNGTGDADNTSFTINDNQLKTATSLDYESRNSCSIRVRVTAADGLMFEKSWNIAVRNVDEPPTDLTISPARVLAKWPAGTLVGTLSASDPDAGDAAGITYALATGYGSTDNATFRIEGGQLKTNAAIPPGRVANYSIRIRATDSGSQAYEKVVLIRAAGLNVAPTSLMLSRNQVRENQSAGTIVGALSAADANINACDDDTFTYSFVGGGGANDNAAFQIVGNELKTRWGFDYEGKRSYSIRVRARDAGGLAFEKSFTIAVTNVSEIGAVPLVINGTSGNDTIALSMVRGKLRVSSNGKWKDYNPAKISNVTINALAGNDKVMVGAGVRAVKIYGGNGQDSLTGGDNNDTVYGGNGNNILHGGGGNDSLYGDAGNDRLYGGAGNDKLYGGTGRDSLYGEDGNDELFASNGAMDYLSGGAGSDRAYWGGWTRWHRG